MLRLVNLLLLALVIALQLKLWVGQSGRRDVAALQAQVERQRDENAELNRRNEELAAEVLDLKTGEAAIEERARGELGMVREGEIFYRVVEPADSRRDREEAPLPQSEAPLPVPR